MTRRVAPRKFCRLKLRDEVKSAIKGSRKKSIYEFRIQEEILMKLVQVVPLNKAQ